MAQPIKKQSWSNIDVFGLLNGLSIWDEQYKNLRYVRTPYENNIEMRDKINAYHQNIPGINKQGLLNALCNEFSLNPYNVTNKTIFELSYTPIPSGNINISDVSGFYKDSNDEWVSIGPQIWGNTYESAKISKNGFIVWQNENFSNISGYKNFSYSTIVEVFREFDDNTELKFIYYVQGKNVYNETILMQYTDMNNPEDVNDNRFTYRKNTENEVDISGNIVLYTLNDIPTSIKDSVYYNKYTNKPYEFLYNLKRYIDKKFKHTWDKITDNSCIWDIHKNYGSGHIPQFYDALAPYNSDNSTIQYSGFIGGIESLSYSLYQSDFIEQAGTSEEWYLKLYPGKFYIDGIPFYYMENPQTSNLDFTLISTGDLSGCYETTIPIGLSRGMYTILSKSGYYDGEKDEYLNNVYETYSYHIGEDGDKIWSNILSRVSYLTNQMGYNQELTIGTYCLDFYQNKIYTNIPSGYTQLTLIWDNVLTPSGTNLVYDLNPLNDQNLTFEKFFLYLTLDPNRKV